MVSVCLDDHTADRYAIQHDAVSFTAVNGVFYRLPGDDLLIFLKMIITVSEFLQRTVIESFLVVLYELFPVSNRQGNKYA